MYLNDLFRDVSYKLNAILAANNETNTNISQRVGKSIIIEEFE
jgi:hypothetical protein